MIEFTEFLCMMASKMQDDEVYDIDDDDDDDDGDHDDDHDE